MAMFTPLFSEPKGRALFSLLFAAPMIHATDSVATKDGETITVTTDIDAAAEATGGYRPLSTSTATLTDMPMLDIPQVVNTVSDQVLGNQDVTILDEASYNVSNVIQTNTLGGAQDVSVHRGFSTNRDGSIITSDLRAILPRSFGAATERVEVLKDPASTLYGTLNLGGLINVVTERSERMFHGSVSAISSSFGGGTGQLDITGPIGDTQLAYHLTGEARNEGYWRNFSKERSIFIAPSLTQFGDNATVTILYSYQDCKTPFDRGTIFDLTTKQPVDVDRKVRFDEPFNITNGQSDLTQLNVEYHLNSQWTARFDCSYSRDKYSDNQARVVAYNAATGILTRRVDATQGPTQRMHAIHADLQGNIDIVGPYNEIPGGVSYEYYNLLYTDMIRCKKAKDFNIYNPVYGNTNKCATISASGSDQTIKRENYSTYVQGALYLTDNWIAVAGVYYQYYTQYAGKDHPFNVNTNSRDEQQTPKLGLVYKLTPSVSLFANYSQTFMPQSSTANYIGDLPPESPDAYEVETKFELFDGIAADIALFDIHRRNVLYTESIGDETIAKMADRVCSGEVEIDLAGALTENINIIASYDCTDARVLGSPDYAREPLPNVPRHTGSLFLAYDIHNVPGNNTLTFGGGGHGISRRSATNGADYYLSGYFVADAFAVYKMKSQYPVTLQLNAKNLFDKTYYTSSIAADDLGNQIGDPHGVQFTVEVEF